MTFREKTSDGVTRITGSSSGAQGIPGEPGIGLPGPPGPPGPGSTTVEFVFTVGSATWYCPHGLGITRVDVITTDGNGDVLEGEVEYIDINTVVVHWYYPMSGIAVIRN